MRTHNPLRGGSPSLRRANRVARPRIALTALLLALLVQAILPFHGLHAPAPVLAAGCASPSFTVAAPIPVGRGADAVATEDLNGDNHLDLVVANFADDTLSVLLGDGAGGFKPAATSPVGDAPKAVAIGDLNGDGRLDLAVANQAGDNIAILLGDGAGGFGPPTYVPSGFDPNPTPGDLQPVALVMVDFNGDGKLDLVVANLNDPIVNPDIDLKFHTRVVLLLGDGAGGFGPQIAFNEMARPASLVVGDFDGDGRPNVVVSNVVVSSATTGQIMLLYFNPNGTIEFPNGTINRHTPVQFPGGALDLVAADVDRDGNLDLAGTSLDDRVAVLRGKGHLYGFETPFEDPAFFPTGGNLPTGIAVADYNGDAIADLAVNNRASSNVGVMLGDGAGGFGAPTVFGVGPNPDAIVADDFNHDGGFDLAVANNVGASVTPLLNSCPLGPIDLRPTAIEVTQVVQSLGNSVVLVEGKRTYVRVHVDTTVDIMRVTARLTLTTGAGVPYVHPLWPINPGGMIDLSRAPDRGKLNDSFLFELPPEMTTGTLTLRAVVNPYHIPSEPDYANNERSETVVFQPTRAFKLRLVEYQYYDTADKLHKPYAGDLNAIESRLRREYPFSQLEVTRTTFTENPDDQAQRYSTTFEFPTDILRMLNRLTWFRQTFEPANTGVIYLAVADNRLGGIAENIPGWNAVAASASNPEVAAHEIGHLLGRRHVQCTPETDDEAGPDPQYPYPGGKIGGPVDDLDRFYGLDVGDYSLTFPSLPRLIANTTGEMMSYCRDTWISDYNYTNIRNRNQTAFSQAAAPAGDLLSVYGTLGVAAQTVPQLVLSRQGQVSEAPPRVPGPYHIRLFDGAGAQLADYPFTPTTAHADGATSVATQSIAQVVAFAPGSRRLAITSDLTGNELISRPISAAAPTVALTTPAGGAGLPATGPVTVGWSAADADGDTLSATILYSADGGATWRALASGVAGASFTLDAAQLPGAAKGAGRFRVVVSDGVLTAAATGGPLTVASKAPVVRIASPLAGATIVNGQVFTLEAVAADLEDGALTGAQVSWSSDRDGPLGAGHLAQAPLLSIGSHKLTATATDRDGQQASASVVVQVVARLGAGRPPVANAGADRTAPEGTTVQLDATGSSDPDGDPLTYTWAVVGGARPEPTLLPPPAKPSFVAADNGVYTLRLSVTDGKDGADEDDVAVTIVNVTPSIAAGDLSLSAASVVENGSVTLSGRFSDPGSGDAHTITIAWGDDATTTLKPAQGARAFSATHQYRDDNPSGTPADTTTIGVTVTDDDGGSATATTSLTIANVAPTITSVTGPTGPLALGAAATVTASIADVGSQDTHTCAFTWDDGTTTAGAPASGGACAATHAFAAAGVYTVGVEVKDDDTGAATSQFQYVVVYDPSAGFVTGGGWITSPPGAYAPDPALTGRANFGFVAKYQKGANTPTGQTEFQFKVANFTFHSDAYQWLVVAGAKAQYKGAGSINGVGGYSFLLTATDRQENGGGGADRFRIKIWQTASGALVYDNVAGAADDIDAANPAVIDGGSIVIHSGG